MHPFFALPPVMLLYRFRYISDVTGKWVRARHVAELHEIARQHEPGRWAIDGTPEIRRRAPEGYFSPFRAGPSPIDHPPLEVTGIVDELERFLALLFLRRYVTWCARTHRPPQAENAARLYRRLV